MFPKLTVLTPLVLLLASVTCAQTMQGPTASASPQAPPAPANLSTSNPTTESWTELSIEKSGLSPEKFNAVLLGRYEEPEYTRELWRVQWRPADPIDLYVVLPHGVVRPHVILYLYDYHYDVDRFETDVWCKAATQGGVAAVGFSSALSLQRQHSPRPMKEWFVSELQEALATSTHDVQMILNDLATRNDLDARQVAMYGQGSGGAIALLTAAVDPRITTLDLLNPWGDWPDWLRDSQQVPDDERSTYLQPAFLQKVAKLDPVDYLPQLKPKRLRIQQMMDDPVTPAAARTKIDAMAPKSAEVIRYPNADGHMAAWRREGLNGWLVDQLTPPANTQAKSAQ
jgi:hypothetical protein